MANQDPQPEIYTVISNFDDLDGVGAGTATGSQLVTNIVTSQANNEEVRIYGMKVNITDSQAVPVSLDPATANDCDFSITITIGANNVPSQTFRVRPTWISNTRTLVFPSPILVLFQQPFRITVITNQALATGGANARTVTLEFLSELAIQKVACEVTPRSGIYG